MHISIIIPILNGEQTIREAVETTIAYFMQSKHKYEIIVVNDCSSDDTFLVLTAMQKIYDITVVNKHVWQGKGAAIKTGLKVAQGDHVLLMDGDLQISPDELDVFFRYMELNNASAVIGNKHHPYSNTAYSFTRRVVSNGYHLLTKVLFGIPLRDTQCGFKLFKADVLRDILDKLLVKQFAFDLELIVALRENNIRIADAPVYVKRPLGRGSVTLKNIFQTLKDTLAVWYRQKKGFYR